MEILRQLVSPMRQIILLPDTVQYAINVEKHLPENSHLSCKKGAAKSKFLGYICFTTFSPWLSCVGLPDLIAPLFYSLNGCFEQISLLFAI